MALQGWRAVAIVVLATLFQGCAITDEFSRRGGFSDRLMDYLYFPADAPQHRVFRSYLLAGTLIRVAADAPINVDDRELISKGSQQILQAAKAALNCAVDECPYFEDSLAVLDRRLYSLAVKILYPEETRDLFAQLRDGLFGKTPVVSKATNSLVSSVRVVRDVAGAIEESAGIVDALLNLGGAAYKASNRLGPLYRDAVLLDARIIEDSLASACGGMTSSTSDNCAVYAKLYEMRASASIGVWALSQYLRNEVGPRGIQINIGRQHWVSASSIIYRACDLLTKVKAERITCRAENVAYPEKSSLIFLPEVKAINQERENSYLRIGNESVPTYSAPTPSVGAVPKRDPAVVQVAGPEPLDGGTLAWEANHPERRAWSAEVRTQVANHFSQLSGASDAPAFCPRYAQLNEADKSEAWAHLIVAIAKFESSYQPNQHFPEPPPLSVDSIGLFQLSYEDGFSWCRLDRPSKSLEDPITNIQCAIPEMARLVARDGIIAGGSTSSNARGLARYWSVVRAGSQNKLAQIKAIVASSKPCRR